MCEEINKNQSKEIFLTQIKSRLPAIIIGAVLAFLLEVFFACYAVNRGGASNNRISITNLEVSGAESVDGLYRSENNEAIFVMEDCPSWGRIELTFVGFLGFKAINIWNDKTIFGASIFLEDWPGFFIMGYLLTRNWMRKYDKFIVCGGVAAFIFSVWLVTNLYDYDAIVLNCSIVSLFITSTIFVIVKHADRFLKRFSRFFTSVSKYSYSIILVHYFVLNRIVCAGLLTSYIPHVRLGRITFLLTLGISFMLAVLIDKLVVNVVMALLSADDTRNATTDHLV